MRFLIMSLCLLASVAVAQAADDRDIDIFTTQSEITRCGTAGDLVARRNDCSTKLERPKVTIQTAPLLSSAPEVEWELITQDLRHSERWRVFLNKKTRILWTDFNRMPANFKEAQGYCNDLNRKLGLSDRLKFRLPRGSEYMRAYADGLGKFKGIKTPVPSVRGNDAEAFGWEQDSFSADKVVVAATALGAVGGYVISKSALGAAGGGIAFLLASSAAAANMALVKNDFRCIAVLDVDDAPDGELDQALGQNPEVTPQAIDGESLRLKTATLAAGTGRVAESAGETHQIAE